MSTTTTAARGLPIWLRVPLTIVLALAGVLAAAVLAGAAGIGGGAGPDKHPPVQRQEQQTGPGDGGGHRPPAGGHG